MHQRDFLHKQALNHLDIWFDMSYNFHNEVRCKERNMHSNIQCHTYQEKEMSQYLGRELKLGYCSYKLDMMFVTYTEALPIHMYVNRSFLTQVSKPTRWISESWV
jgi:hypothetical protein